MARIFGMYLDVDAYALAIWTINIPVGFRETLWQEMNGAQAIGHRYRGKCDLMRECLCGTELSLDHILMGCRRYNLVVLERVLHDRLWEVSPSFYHKSLHPDSWKPSPWYPLLALKRVEQNSIKPSKTVSKPNKAFSDSRATWEWLVGSFFWELWKWRMKEANEPTFKFLPKNHVAALVKTLAAPVARAAAGPSGSGPPRDGSGPAPAVPTGDLMKLPPPVSHLERRGAGTRLSSRGESILHAIRAPAGGKGLVG